MNVKQLLLNGVSILLICNSSQLQQEEPYNYKNLLKGGYNIKFTYDQDEYHLFLQKQNHRIAEIASCSRGMLYKNLGYIMADFTNHFVLAHSFGSGNPRQIELICKATGKNIIVKSAAWIDVDEQKEVLLYSLKDVPSEKDKMVLYNIMSGRVRYLSFPRDIFGIPQILNRIHIKNLAENELIISYETEGGSKLKKYSL
jgi:hypothetical protein